MKFKRKGGQARYDFVDAKCIGRPCWAPGMYQHRAPLAGGGSRNTGSPDSPCCLNHAYHGCPDGPVGARDEQCDQCDENGLIEVRQAAAGHYDDLAEYEHCHFCGGGKTIKVAGLPEYQAELAKTRKDAGWKAA